MTLSEALALFLRDSLRRCTAGAVATYRKRLATFVDHAGAASDVCSLAAADLSAYVASLRARERRLSPVTIRKRAQALRTFFSWCKREGLRSDDPSALLDLPRVGHRLPKALSFGDERRLLACELDPVERAAVELILDSGLRLSEAAGLRWGDLDFDRGTVHVAHGKGDKERFSVIGDAAAASLLAWCHCRLLPPEAGEYVFVGRQGPLTSGGLYRVVKRAMARAGVKGSPHDLRHTFARDYLDAGGNLFDLKELLGHTDIRTTAIYLSVARESLSAKHALFSPVNRLRNGAAGGHRSPDRRSGEKIVELAFGRRAAAR